MSDDDSPLLTPEATRAGGAGGAGDRGDSTRQRKTDDDEEDRLLTPEPERTAELRRAPSKNSPAGPGAANGNTSSRGGAAVATNGSTKRKVADEPVVSGASATSSADKYRRIKKVGVGAYGSVFMAENTETKDLVAIKLTSRKEDPIYGGFGLSLLREINILRALNHPNIVTLHEITTTEKGDPLIVMEYCQSSLLELLNSRRHNLSFSEVKYVIRQILDATRHMHEKGVLHRDLATKNVLFNTSGEIKVCDFGISRMGFGIDEEFGFLPAKNLERPDMIVSLPYRAIELLIGKANYGPALDIWAAGCILGEILLCQGGMRRTFFGGDAERPNKDVLSFVEEIFRMCGRPTEDTWPGLTRLPLYKGFMSSSNQLDRLQAHDGPGEERSFLRRFFTSGVGKCAHTKYSLTEGCFDLLGQLLTLCPEKRRTAEETLKHNFFNEKPVPEWHAWHWALDKEDIARGDDMRKQDKDGDDEARTMLRKLAPQNESKEITEVKTNKQLHKESLEKRANERKKEEESRQAKLAAQRDAAKKKAADASEKMPPGWTKHWSSSKGRYYYHDSSTKTNLWHPPPSAA